MSKWVKGQLNCHPMNYGVSFDWAWLLEKWQNGYRVVFDQSFLQGLEKSNLADPQLISVYIVCQLLWKVLNILIWSKYHQKMLEIDFEMSIAQLSWNE